MPIQIPHGTKRRRRTSDRRVVDSTENRMEGDKPPVTAVSMELSYNLVKNWLEYKGDTREKEEKAGEAGGYPGCYSCR